MEFLELVAIIVVAVPVLTVAGIIQLRQMYDWSQALLADCDDEAPEPAVV